jgi:DNA-binding transcriptional regulator YiaG
MIKEVSIEQVERVRNLYRVISNRLFDDSPENLQRRVDIIRELEKLTHQEFLSTQDFHEKVNLWIRSRGGICSDAIRFQEARKSASLTQGQLAEILGVTKRNIQHWEEGTRKLPKKALEWLNCQKTNKNQVPRPSGGEGQF